MKKLTSLILAASVFAATFVPASAQARFADADGHWAENYITELSSADILHGYPNGTVKPNQAITQAEFAALLVQTAGLETAEQNGAWYLPFANALKENGVADEISPNEPITRLKLVEWALRSMGGNKLTASKVSDFTDLGSLTESEKNMVVVADEIGLISGYPDGTFKPNSTCTRAEAFAILCGYSAASERVKALLSPTISSGAAQQMSVNVDAPSTAETYSPVEVKVMSQNVQSLDWTVSGFQDEVAVTAEFFESNLNENGGEITFFQPGSYTLTAVATSKSGQKSEVVHEILVREPAIQLTAPSETQLYWDFSITRTVRKDVTNLTWTVKKDGAEWTEIDPSSTFCFESCGRYEFTLSGTDGDGNAVSATCEVLAYQPVYGWFYGAESNYLGDSAEYYVSEFWLAEGMTAEWQVLENGEILDWNSVIDGELDTVGGTIIFKRTGKFEIRLVVTDWVGHVTTMSVETEVPPMPYLPEPTFTLPEVAYTQTAFAPSVTADLGPYEIKWSFTDESGKSVRNFSVEGGAITSNAAGNYTVTATISDGVRHTKSHSEEIIVREKPHIRMNPLDRETYEERLNYVCNLHLGTSDTSYPTFTNTDGMAVKFELFENGKPADESTAYFTPRANSYTFQPKRVGDFTVRATATDEFGNSFVFETKYHVVPVVAAEITGLSDTATVNETLAVGVTQHNMNGESVMWKLAKISEDDADMTYGLSNLWLTSDGWQEIDFGSVCTANLTDLGGEISFFQSGIFCLRTEVTDQYGTTTERYKVMKVE